MRLHATADRCVVGVIEVGGGRVGALPVDRDGTAALATPGDAEHGRGVALMRALVDQVGFRLLPELGTVVSLEKRLRYAGGGAGVDEAALADGDEADRPG